MSATFRFDENILPGNDRLLRGIKTTLRRLAARTAEEQLRVELGAIDWILGELLLRHQPDFYVRHYAGLRQLVERGLGLLGDRLVEAAAAKIAGSWNGAPKELDPQLDFEAMGRAINGMMHCLAALIEAARESKSAAVQEYVVEVCAKENEFHHHHVAVPGDSTDKASGGSLSQERLQEYLNAKFPDRKGLQVAQFKQLVGGYQKVTILFDVEDAAGQRESWVLRSEKDDRFLTLDAGNVRDEFGLVTLAFEAGVPVAEPLWLEADKSRLGQSFFVSRKVAGENYGTAMASDRPVTVDLARSFIETMARIHLIPPNDAMRRSVLGRWLDFPTLADNTRANVLYWMNQPWMAQANPSPLYTRLTTWLLDNVPQDVDSPRLTHGDFGPHNVLVKDGRVAGVVDWEAAHFGDPSEDISWFLQSCSGKIGAVDALQWYEEFSGCRISEFRLRYFDVFNSLKILTGAAAACPMFEMSENASIEWCNIPLRWAPFSAALVVGKIAAAEAAKPGK